MNKKSPLATFDHLAIYELQDPEIMDLVSVAGGIEANGASHDVMDSSNSGCTNVPCADNIGCTNAGCTEVNVTCPTQQICAQIFC